ncbi:helix-turn-helix domain-containing protein [Anaerocolumna chitinilytica]|uniref:Class I SAM-dependent methyltransferase n=1 Tax=Anaerocolumna chitinilytica TaxID=1727145 RepID=A0A7I8DPS5_9FIRM|nr:helix-turn-helix domain-containing protein [Anaerocolumna chitinilytica]BCJ98286.1 class I SAM-dependent methyltransferase [Anaerocolumna chitinilytica]
MTAVKLRIAELRREKGVGQQELAEVLGVSFQSVSKWENGITMPDITLLPDIAEYFHISVDELLGLKPLHRQEYIPSGTDNRDTSNGKEKTLYKNRKYFWNGDYMEFLIKMVWKVETSVDVIEFRCGEGYLGHQLLSLLPMGSTYTGIDNEYFAEKAKLKFKDSGCSAEFIVSDIYSFDTEKKYDIAIIQAGLRHMNRPVEVLKKMKDTVRKGGLIIAVDVNREFENTGLYIEDMDYEYLCTGFDFHKIWRKELQCEGRDYAIGMRLPFYMRQLGLHDVDIRINDRAFFVNPDRADYEQMVQDFIDIRGLDKSFDIQKRENIIEHFMNRGMDKSQAEDYISMQSQLAEYLKSKKDKTFLNIQGLLITYGWK